jgi:hypothetical protein
MSSRRSVRQVLVAVLLGVLVGGGLMAVTPAGAEVSSAVATNWKKIWKKKLQPQADKRYHTKKKSDARYQPKGSYETAGSGYAKAETYSRTESDGKYQSKTQLIRGTFFAAGGSSAGAAFISGEGISLGVTFAAVPTVRYMKLGDPLAPGCLGSAASPDAQPGFVCVFETAVLNMSTNRGTLDLAGGIGMTAFGGPIFGQTAGAGDGYMLGSWAARPGAVAAGSPAPSAPAGKTGGLG